MSVHSAEVGRLMEGVKMSYRMAACQMNTRSDKAANLRTAERLIDEAVAGGADFVALPEMFNIYGTREEIRGGREPEGGPTTEFLSRLSRRHGIYIHGGSIPIAVPDSDKSWNATYVFNRTGDIIASYRKVHLFDIDFTGQVEANESSRYEAGQEQVAFECEHGVLGLTICYDVRFPELYRSLTLAGARVAFQPSAFTQYTGQHHWEALIRVRAIENQIYMVSPAQVGIHAGDQHCYGHTMIVDPWGEVLGCLAQGEGVVLADIDYEHQDKVRAGLPVLAHRRPQVYAKAVNMASQLPL